MLQVLELEEKKYQLHNIHDSLTKITNNLEIIFEISIMRLLPFHLISEK